MDFLAILITVAIMAAVGIPAANGFEKIKKEMEQE